ncbi:hypothetical protein E2C01_019611 [Portunus trituberculatus]|uniref:Uncharacterized protein n=1 Tax=Portunus trituberculatus TaxID=210409 RepID=A0A5B7DXP5_PORTR|nr:hypothetical protein [Portunus trituberculatus]
MAKIKLQALPGSALLKPSTSTAGTRNILVFWSNFCISLSFLAHPAARCRASRTTISRPTGCDPYRPPTTITRTRLSTPLSIFAREPKSSCSDHTAELSAFSVKFSLTAQRCGTSTILSSASYLNIDCDEVLPWYKQPPVVTVSSRGDVMRDAINRDGGIADRSFKAIWVHGGQNVNPGGVDKVGDAWIPAIAIQQVLHQEHQHLTPNGFIPVHVSYRLTPADESLNPEACWEVVHAEGCTLPAWSDSTPLLTPLTLGRCLEGAPANCPPLLNEGNTNTVLEGKSLLAGDAWWSLFLSVIPSFTTCSLRVKINHWTEKKKAPAHLRPPASSSSPPETQCRSQPQPSVLLLRTCKSK